MIVPKHGFKKIYAYGGSGIFDTMVNLLTRMFTSSAAKQIASSALDVGKSVAKEGAKKALEVGKSAAVDVGKKLVTKALTPKSKKILQKYTEPVNSIFYINSFSIIFFILRLIKRNMIIKLYSWNNLIYVN